MTKRYIVFERPAGSNVWTIAFKPLMTNGPENNVPATFSVRENAVAWVKEVHSKLRFWMNGVPDAVSGEAHIAEVELPE